ncbi:MAG: tryptophan synthase subunit alpha [Candidatus Eremiobacteraeota bacterium]|nr:tryptophan synthase subunit alpha [Candidatus Eremiobacteraeota bacterium]
MMLANVFQKARTGRAAFIPYLMAGDPDLATTALLLAAVVKAGADCIELGIPYGDPLADGPTIAAAGARALRQHVTIDDVLGLIKAVPIPVVLFGYYNPILQYGLARFAANAAAAGAKGVIVPDVALEEAEALRDMLHESGLSMPLLVAPSTPLARAKRIAEHSTGFLYVVSRLGVTGAASVPNFRPLESHLRELRTVTDLPLAVGFGLSSPEHVRAIARHADGIIVGSALIDAYHAAGPAGAAQAVERVVNALVSAAYP